MTLSSPFDGYVCRERLQRLPWVDELDKHT